MPLIRLPNRLSRLILRRGANRTERLLAAAAAATLGLSLVLGAAALWLEYEARLLELRAERLGAELLEAQEQQKRSKSRLGFLATLPSSVDAQALGATLQRLSITNKVDLISLKSSAKKQTAQMLAHERWDLELQGTYPALKSYLADAVESGELYILELELNRNAEGRVDAKVALAAWLAPTEARP